MNIQVVAQKPEAIAGADLSRRAHSNLTSRDVIGILNSAFDRGSFDLSAIRSDLARVGLTRDRVAILGYLYSEGKVGEGSQSTEEKSNEALLRQVYQEFRRSLLSTTRGVRALENFDATLSGQQC